MASQIKIKDEPLDSGYGDVLIKNEITTSANDDTENDLSGIFESVPDLFNEVDTQVCPAKIKSEPSDSSKNPHVKIKNEPQDLPDDFFDCLNDNFLDDIVREQDENMSGVDEPRSENQRFDDSDDKEKHCLFKEEIKKVSKKIHQKKKLALQTSALGNANSAESNENKSVATEKGIKLEKHREHKSHNHKSKSQEREKQRLRSRERRHSKDSTEERSSRSPLRWNSRSRSREKSYEDRYFRNRKRRRSRSKQRRQTRSKSRSTTRSQSKSRSRERNSKAQHSRSRSPYSKRRSSSFDHKRKRPSFLEELEKTFAKKGIPFPEKEKLKLVDKEEIMREYQKPETFGQRLAESKMYNNDTAVVHSSALHELVHTRTTFESTHNENDDSFPLPIQIKTELIDEPEKETEEDEFPRPIQFKEEAMDEEEATSSNSNVNKKLMKLKEEKLLETPEERRQRVLNRCTEAMKKLHFYEQGKPITKLVYTPTVIKQTDITEKFKNSSPLNRINNVQFKFNSLSQNDIDVTQYGIISLPKNSAKVASIIGIDAYHIMEKLNHNDLPYSLKILRRKQDDDYDVKSGKFYKPFYTSTATQTEAYTCDSCLMKKRHDIGVQIQPFVEDSGIQVNIPIMNAEIQQQHQQIFYPNVQQQQQQMSPVMFGYGRQTPQLNSYNAQSYPYSSYQAQQMNSFPQSSMMNVVDNSVMPMQSTNTILPPQHNYSSMPSHPGPRNLPSSKSSASSNVRRRNLVVPRTTFTPHNQSK